MRSSPHNCFAIILLGVAAVVGPVLSATAGEKTTVIEMQGATIAALYAAVDNDTVSLPIGVAGDAIADDVKVLPGLFLWGFASDASVAVAADPATRRRS
jgi:hypothetical protein